MLARQRIVDSFWTLLEEYSINKINVSMVTEKAECSRGIFYRYFENMRSLSCQALRGELFTETELRRYFVANLVDQVEVAKMLLKQNLSSERIALFVERGGLEISWQIVAEMAEEAVGVLFCLDGKDIQEESKDLVRVLAAGIFGLVLSINNDGSVKTRLPADNELLIYGKMAERVAKEICAIQGIKEHELLAGLFIQTD